MQVVQACAAASVLWFLALGCALTYPPGSQKYVPEFLPTKSIADLLAEPLPVTPANKELQFDLIVYPRLVMAGQTVRLTCLVPPSWGAGYVRLALEGIQASIGRIHYAETSRLIEGVPCGSWQATCSTDTQHGLRTVTRELVARGLCNSEGSEPPAP